MSFSLGKLWRDDRCLFEIDDIFIGSVLALDRFGAFGQKVGLDGSEAELQISDPVIKVNGDSAWISRIH